MDNDLAAAPAWAFAFALVLCRCGAAVMLLPGLGEAEYPAPVRAGVAVLMVLLVLPAVGPVPAPDGWRAAGMACAELLWGGALGWLARCAVLALPMAGQLTSYCIGLSSVLSPDPALGQSSTLMRLYALAAAVLVLGGGLWALPVAALAGSYDVVPPGHMLPVADAVEVALSAAGGAFAAALRLASPLVLASIAWQAALGLLNRLIPQLPVQFAAVPGQLAGGLVLLALLSGPLQDAWLDYVRDTLIQLPVQ